MPSYTISLTIRLPADTHQAVQAAADAEHVSVYRWLQIAVSERLARTGKEQTDES